MAVIAPSRVAERVSSGPVRVTAEELRPLGWFERLAFRFCDAIHRRPWAKRLSQAFLLRIGTLWVWFCTRHLVRFEGAEVLNQLDLTKPLLLCSNHRSFFDMYVLSCYFSRLTGRFPNLYFPVRANFFYEGPLGMFVNMVMAAFSMYPPIFRQPEKRGFNFYSLARTVELAQTPGNLIGFHPEGTRGKGPDPYQLLPAQPGVGQIIYEARPTVLPVFIHGLSNHLPSQIVGNFTRKGRPIWLVFGQPVELEDFYAKSNRLRTHKEIADFVLFHISQLGERERLLRCQEAGAPSNSSSA